MDRLLGTEKKNQESQRGDRILRFRSRNRTGANRTGEPRPLEWALSWALPWMPSWDVSWGVLEGLKLGEAKPGGFQTGGFPLFLRKNPDCVADPFGTVPRRRC